MGWLFGTELTEALQAAMAPTLNLFFIFLTLLGEDFFYIALIGAVYLCVHKKAGITLGYLMLFGFYTNYFAKMLFNMDRPPDSYRIIGQGDISHGFPSGHAQSATTFWTWVALKTKLKALFFISPLMIFLVSLSRIYLGVHYPGDVIGGFVIGLAFTLIVYFSYPSIMKLLGNFPPGVRQLVVPVMALALFAISLMIFPDTTRDDPASVCGALFGFSVGLALEDKYVGFTTDRTTTRTRLIRLIIGMAILGVLYVGLAPLLPSANVFAKFGRYAIVTLGAAFIVPLISSRFEKAK